MRILSVEFDGAVGAPGGPPPADALPQVAFVGRSNVGKSSLINRVLGRTRTQMARVSGRPGKTREINFYRVRARLDEQGERDVAFHLVDLPGYGYAKVPEEVREAWGRTIDRYLGESDRLRGVVQLIDARHEPTADDRKMMDFLAALGAPVLVVATKIDKLKRGARAATLSRAVRALGVDADQMLAFSSVSGEGRRDLLDSLADLIGSAPAGPAERRADGARDDPREEEVP